MYLKLILNYWLKKLKMFTKASNRHRKYFLTEIKPYDLKDNVIVDKYLNCQLKF